MTFDRVVIVDWSANSTPKLGRDSIWMAIGDGSSVVLENLATRAAACDRLWEIAGDCVGHRLLLGVDFSLGYPAGTAHALGLDGVASRSTWELLASLVTDDGRNQNNRFDVANELNRRISAWPGPFWGCPTRSATAGLQTTKPGRSANNSLAEWRTVEHVLRSSGMRPFSCWQLLGAGVVGSQSLLGIAALERFRRRIAERVRVWPFDTGLHLPIVKIGDVVIAEVWPSLIAVDEAVHPVLDACQVDAVARWLRAADDAGRLVGLFEPYVDDRTRAMIVEEEGWVLGVSGQTRTPYVER